MREQANALLQALGELPGGTGAALRLDRDDDALCVIGDVPTLFSYSDELEEMVASVCLFPLPEGAARAKVVRVLMQANYGWGGTDGGVIGLDEETEQMLLSRRFPLESETAETFVEKVARMHALALHYRDAVRGFGDAPGAAVGLRA